MKTLFPDISDMPEKAKQKHDFVHAAPPEQAVANSHSSEPHPIEKTDQNAPIMVAQRDSGPRSDWEKICEKLIDLLDQETYRRFISPLTIEERGHNLIAIIAPNADFYQELQSHYFEKIESCKEPLGLNHLKILLEHKGQRVDGSNSTGKASVTTPPQEVVGSRLNKNHTFENFVRGPSNQFALASCLMVAENPGKIYNPLFLYGSTGLGKTHLLHAVGNCVLKHKENAIVTYISSERFMNEMILSIRHNKMWDFRQKYRNCDVFMVDDIQFISGKIATQEEFFHTFNTLHGDKKQIIITSDKFPQEIPDIEQRLMNRFQWGLIADIQPPDMEHRLAILMNKADQLKVDLPSDVGEYIAKNAKKNIRELEGALHRVTAFSALHGKSISMDLAKEIFKDVFGDQSQNNVSIEVIQKMVADRFKLKVNDLKSKKRHRAFTVPRQIAMYLARVMTKSSYPEIGERFGGKDHSTVMHAIKQVQKGLLADILMKQHVDALERDIEQASN